MKIISARHSFLLWLYTMISLSGTSYSLFKTVLATFFVVLTNTVSILVNYIYMRTPLGAEVNWHDAAHISGSKLF